MITHDGFRKKKCFLDGNNMIVGNEIYPIFSLNKINHYKSRSYFVLIVMAVFTMFLIYAGYMGVQDDIINNPDMTDQTVKAILWLFIFGLFISLWIIIVKFEFKDSRNSRSYWLVNGKALYVEKDDDISTETRLRDLEMQLVRSEIKARDLCARKTGKDVRLLIIIFASFFVILYLGLTGVLKEDIYLPIILSLAAIIFVFRFYDLKKEFDNLKWKK